MKKSEKRQTAVFDYINDMIDEKGFPPTTREICAALGIGSTSTVYSDINALIEKGLLQKDPSKPRAITVMNKNASGERSSGPYDINTIEVPVVGRVAAGIPILAAENIEDSIPMPARFIGSGNHFILTVHGSSMINAGINDGDYILVQEKHEANSGDIVVAMIDGDFESEATVKRFYRENGHIRLQPENDNMDPIIVPDCSIVGRVRGVFRYIS